MATDFATIAKKLIAKHGRTGNFLKRPQSGTADASTPWKPSPSSVPTDDLVVASALTCVYMDASTYVATIRSTFQQAVAADTSDSLVAECNVVCLLAAAALPDGTEPLVGDLMEKPTGQRLEVLKVGAVEAGSTMVLYTLQLKN